MSTIHELTLQQVKIALRTKIKNIFKVIRADSAEPERGDAAVPRPYQKPTLKKLTPEQAKLLLIGHSSIGTEGANDLLGLIFPDPVFPRPGYSRPGQTRPEQASA
jgi:hypothetical protein